MENLDGANSDNGNCIFLVGCWIGGGINLLKFSYYFCIPLFGAKLCKTLMFEFTFDLMEAVGCGKF